MRQHIHFPIMDIYWYSPVGVFFL